MPPTPPLGASPGFFCSVSGFWLAGLLACSLACLFACFQRFSRPHSFAHSEREPKECAGSRKEKERNQRSAPAAEKEKGRKKAGRAGRDRASALKTVPCRCLSAVPGRTRLPPTASTNKRSAKTGRTGRDRASALKAVASRCLSTLGLISSGAVGVVASHPLSMREGPGSIPSQSMPMCACVGLSRFWDCCSLRRSECGLSARWTRSCSCWLRPGDR